MKKLLLLFAFVTLQISCINQTPEEKASKLVEAEIKQYLYKPNTYKMIYIQIDSCFSDVTFPNVDAIRLSKKVLNLYKEYKEIKEEVNDVEYYMNLYSDCYTSYSKYQYEKYKKEFDFANTKLNDKKNQIIDVYKNNMNLIQNIVNKNHEFIGMFAVVVYTAENLAGYPVQSSMMYFFDKDITKIIYYTDEDDAKELEEISEEFKYDFGEILGTLI